MEGTDIDFEGGAGTQPAANADVNPANQEDTTSLDGGGTEDVTGKSNETQTPEEPADKSGKTDNQDGQGNDSNDSTLEAGTQIEFDGNTYTVANNGDIVDS